MRARCWCSTSTPSTACRPAFETLDTAAEDPAQLYYTSGTTGLAKGIVHAHRYLLGHEEFDYCHDVQRRRALPRHGRVGVGGRHLPAARARGGAARCSASTSARAGFDPHRQLAFLSRHEVTNVFATPTAIRSMMSIGDARTRYPQRFRIVCSAGEPLNPEAIRWFREQYGVTVLDYYGLTESYPLCGNFPFMEVREGSMGRPMPGWEVAILDEDEQPVPTGERGEICLRARTNPHYPLGYWRLPAAERGDLRRRVVPHQGRGAHGRGRLRLVRGPRRRRDHLGRLPDRPVRGRVGVPRAPGGRRGGGGRLAATSAAATSSRRSSCSPPGHEPSDELARGDQGASCATACRRTPTRARSSSSHELPKTLTGKIRRVELREREAARPGRADALR